MTNEKVAKGRIIGLAALGLVRLSFITEHLSKHVNVTICTRWGKPIVWSRENYQKTSPCVSLRFFENNQTSCTVSDARIEIPTKWQLREKSQERR